MSTVSTLRQRNFQAGSIYLSKLPYTIALSSMSRVSRPFTRALAKVQVVRRANSKTAQAEGTKQYLTICVELNCMDTTDSAYECDAQNLLEASLMSVSQVTKMFRKMQIYSHDVLSISTRARHSRRSDSVRNGWARCCESYTGMRPLFRRPPTSHFGCGLDEIAFCRPRRPK